VLIHPWDAAADEDEWRAFLAAHPFGQLVAAGRGRDLPVVVPTQYVLVGHELFIHLIRRNPIFDAVRENPHVMLSVTGDWVFVPSSWKALPGEDPRLGIPTTYYAAVQLAAVAEIVDGTMRSRRSCAPNSDTSSPTRTSWIRSSTVVV
jgi:transcriptional regulator